MKIRKLKRRKAARQSRSMIPVIMVDTQGALDRARSASEPVLITGGTDTRPLVIREKFECRPVVGDGACVLLAPADRSHPPDVLIAGNGANVVLLGTSRATCRGESMVRAKGNAKVRMYAGEAVAGGEARITLYGTSTAIAYGRVKCYCRNNSIVHLYEKSRAWLYHDSTAHLCSGGARAWQRDRGARIRQHNWDTQD